MKLVLSFIITCLFMVKTSEASNSLDSLNKELSQKCPWLTESTVGDNDDGVKKCLMALNVEDLKKMLEEELKILEEEARAKGNTQVAAVFADAVKATQKQTDELSDQERSMLIMAVISGARAAVAAAAPAA